jgi:hypothetical protein
MKPYLYLLSLIFMLSACEYEPGGLYEVDVEPVTEAPDITVNLNFLSDTIYIPVSGYTTLEYSTPDSKVRFALFKLNNRQLSKIESTSGTFTFGFNSGQYQKGLPYELTVELFRGSGSGSLADKLDAEGFLYSKTFILYFLDDADMAAQIISVVPLNGSLRIEWERFSGVGFRNYHVFNSVFYKIDIISDQNRTFLYDESYIGYNGDYYIVTETDNGSFASRHVQYHEGLLEAVAQKGVDLTVEVSWGKSKFENNIVGYRIFESYNRFNYFDEVAYIEGGSASGYTFEDSRFGVETRFYILPVPKKREIPLNSYDDLRYMASSTNDVLIGSRMPVYPFSFFHKPQGDFCYFTDIYNVYKFDCVNNLITDSITSQNVYMTVSSDGKRILSSKPLQLEVTNAEKMEVADVIPGSSFPDQEMPVQFVIANNGKGVFYNQKADYYFYDYLNKSAEATFRIDGESNLGDNMKMSPDGQYFCIRHIKGIWPNYLTELFKLENGEAALVWSRENTGFFDFEPVNGQLIYFKNGILTRMSPDNMTVISELPVSDEYFFDIDWNNNEYVSLNEERDLISIHDLNTGELKKEVKTYNFADNTSNFGSLFLSNKILFTEGLRLKLIY